MTHISVTTPLALFTAVMSAVPVLLQLHVILILCLFSAFCCLAFTLWHESGEKRRGEERKGKERRGKERIEEKRRGRERKKRGEGRLEERRV